MTERDDVTISREYLRDLERKLEDLKILTEISAIISSTLDFNELITLVMDKAKSVLNAEACSILLYNKDTNRLEFEIALCKEASASDILRKKITLEMGQGIAGWVAQNQEMLVIKDVKEDLRFYQEADKITGFITRNLIAAPLVGRRGLIGVAEIINYLKEDYDLDILKILIRQFAIAIENALYHKDSLERERLKQELEIASALQKSFLPESPVFQKGNIKVSAVNIPAKQVGGDLYDFIEPVEGKAGIFIGDISGKGVSAALYMAKIISEFRYIAHTVDSPETVMNRLNTLISKAPRGMFLTAVYMIADILNGQLKLSIAGHPPFLWLTKGEVRIASYPAGPPLGIIQEEYSSSTLSMENGDRLLLLTDGVFDAKNKEGKRIGFDNLVAFVRKFADEEDLIGKITEYIDEFARGMERADDLTIVEVRFA